MMAEEETGRGERGRRSCLEWNVGGFSMITEGVPVSLLVSWRPQKKITGHPPPYFLPLFPLFFLPSREIVSVAHLKSVGKPRDQNNHLFYFKRKADLIYYVKKKNIFLIPLYLQHSFKTASNLDLCFKFLTIFFF